MNRKVPTLLALVFVFLLALPACTDIPDEPPGGRILGSISYLGTVHLSMRRPAIRVLANVDFPPTSDPIAFQIIEAGEQKGFPTKVDYELKGIDPFQYKLVAQLVDLLAIDIAATELPLGGYPDFCSLMSPEAGWVVIDKKTPVKAADFQMYDNAGSEDPCNAPATMCPKPGKSSMNLTIKSEKMPTSADRLIFGLFSTFPSMTPTRSRILASDTIAFPQTILDNAIAPGNYAALYVCLDVGGNSGTGMCTSEDAFLLATPPTPLVFPADKIANLIVDLDNRQLIVQGIDTPASHACEEPAP